MWKWPRCKAPNARRRLEVIKFQSWVSYKLRCQISWAAACASRRSFSRSASSGCSVLCTRSACCCSSACSASTCCTLACCSATYGRGRWWLSALSGADPPTTTPTPTPTTATPTPPPPTAAAAAASRPPARARARARASPPLAAPPPWPPRPACACARARESTLCGQPPSPRPYYEASGRAARPMPRLSRPITAGTPPRT